jgi:hypothetical protein
MKPKSYIIIAVPPGKLELTEELLAQCGEQLPYLDVRTKESEDGKFHAAEVFIDEVESVKEPTTGSHIAGMAAMSAAAHIIFRVTGDTE